MKKEDYIADGVHLHGNCRHGRICNLKGVVLRIETYRPTGSDDTNFFF